MIESHIAAIVVFALVYVVIVAGEHTPRKIDRPSAALTGAALMIVTGVLTARQALDAIDVSTIALLLGMMVVIAYASASGLVEWIARQTLRRASNPAMAVIAVGAASGVLSALFLNDTICLLLTPIVLTLTRRLSIRAEPFLIALATCSNVGSVATLTGNPQNMLIGQSSGWLWGAYALRMAPVALICLAINIGLVLLIYRRDLRTATFERNDDSSDGIRLEPKLALKTAIVLCGLLIAFVLGVSVPVAALTAAVAIALIANRPPQKIIAAIDWSLLFFFAGLFVVVAGFTRTEGSEIFCQLPTTMPHPAALANLVGLSAVSLVGSNLFSNVPFVILVRGWIASHGNPASAWLMLAASTTLAGNLTLVGSIANLIVAQGSRREAPLRFTSFLKVGVPSTLITTAVAVASVWLIARLGWT